MESKINFVDSGVLLKCLFLLLISFQQTVCDVLESETTDLFKIDGKVDVVSTQNKEWLAHTRILVDGGKYISHLRSDGSFVVNGLPTGSYVVDVSNPDFIFESCRVDITSKGKIRARRVNLLQPGLVKTVHYPLEFRERRKANYFQQREQWKITDFLMNPMVLTMILPLLLIMVLPKLMNVADPEAQKEMQSQMKAFNDKSSMPDMSEMLAGWLGTGTANRQSAGKKGRK